MNIYMRLITTFLCILCKRYLTELAEETFKIKNEFVIRLSIDEKLIYVNGNATIKSMGDSSFLIKYSTEDY
ncbi:uncharacterized protein OCT59_019276 [Rhizophagus irregularis]|uniref:uncharacterized protein n=1 Tax=Rhizophagus irregularis TaxID=588596 RepID=UPI0033246A4D|nr:hypothetical protein OCT59_019276 [Rhizophagus irregularis]